MKLIDKDKVVAEIERIRTYYENLQTIKQVYNNHIDNCNDLLDFLDTLEVKEVNFEKELDEWMRYGPHTSYPWCTIPDAIKITAEHFYELGLKQK